MGASSFLAHPHLDEELAPMGRSCESGHPGFPRAIQSSPISSFQTSGLAAM